MTSVWPNPARVASPGRPRAIAEAAATRIGWLGHRFVCHDVVLAAVTTPFGRLSLTSPAQGADEQESEFMDGST